MKIKKYYGSSMREVLSRIRQDMGDNAVILHTRSYYERDGWRFWRKRERVEVTASPDVRIVEEPVPSNPRASVYKKVAKNLQTSSLPAIENSPSIHVPREVLELQKELGEIKKMTETLLNRFSFSTHYPDAFGALVRVLKGQEVCEDFIDGLVERLKGINYYDTGVLQEKALTIISEVIGLAEPIRVDKTHRPYKVALIGPTGVGKTTTIAKLAARFSLIEMKKVGLLTVDTFRIAAVDQLKTYAEIMRIPVEVVVSPQDIPSALERLRHCDIVFIDTAGRSQRNEMQMSELRTFIDLLAPEETHLVLSATSNQKTLKQIIDRFSVLKVDKLLFTKMDETLTPGIVISAVHWLNRPISYVTIGQSVPDDIEELDREKIINVIKGELSDVGSGAKTTRIG